jgi:hypothetical protein
MTPMGPVLQCIRLLTVGVCALSLAVLVSGCGPSKPAASAGGTNSAAFAKTNAAGMLVGTNILAETNSIFDDKRKDGRDPFFPNSIRRGGVAPRRPKAAVTNASAIDAGSTNEPVPPPKVDTELKLVLNGIIRQEGQRIAVLNGRTLATNETVTLNNPNGKKVRVRCLEIGSRSVTVTVDGKPEPQKIFLKHSDEAK